LANVPGYDPGVNRLVLTTVSPVRIFAAFLQLIAAAVLWLLVVAVATGQASSAALSIVGACASLLALNAIVQLAGGLRSAAWLEGTTLVVRRAFGTHRCDLSRSRVCLGTSLGAWYLTAGDAATGQSVRLRLGGAFGRTIEAPKLLALADVIMAGGRQDPEAWRVAAGLRERAAPPSPVKRG
jgi:hypothetical protein